MSRRSALIAAVLAWAVIASVGVVAATPRFPAGIVALVNSSAPLDDVSASQFCSGVLIDVDHVLTALHCVESRVPSTLDVILDARNLCSTAPIDGERVEVLAVDAVDSGVDAAVLTIAQPLAAHSPAVAAEFVEPGAPLAPGTRLEAWGWGAASLGGASPCAVEPKLLRSVGLDACALELERPRAGTGFSAPDYVCAVPREWSRNTCVGDSGGPVYTRIVTGERRLVGVTLAGRGCGAGDPGLYLALSNLLS
jgi:trypsin